MDFIEQIRRVKEASQHLALIDDVRRNKLLSALSQHLRTAIDRILCANKKDLENIRSDESVFDRVLLNENRINQIAQTIDDVVVLPTPIQRIIDEKILPNGLRIRRISVPLGVVAVIYEARPNVTIDSFTLCFKAGNACILKGGKHAYNSNLVLVEIIQETLRQQGFDSNIVQRLESNRDQSNLLMRANGLIDVCIPRGGKDLIDFVRRNATIPVIETGAGVVHAYFDRDGDIGKGCAIVNNSKTRRVSVCNALDCLLIHQSRLDDLYSLVRHLQDQRVEILADTLTYDVLSRYYPDSLLKKVTPQDFGREFLSYAVALKAVESVDEAIQHIMEHTSGHSEAIITENTATADYFMQRVDAAVVYVNASTAFTDGAQFGLGTEIGISTQKLHARGPMALNALTSYKWLVYGNGQIREAT